MTPLISGWYRSDLQRNTPLVAVVRFQSTVAIQCNSLRAIRSPNMGIRNIKYILVLLLAMLFVLPSFCLPTHKIDVAADSSETIEVHNADEFYKRPESCSEMTLGRMLCTLEKSKL